MKKRRRKRAHPIVLDTGTRPIRRPLSPGLIKAVKASGNLRTLAEKLDISPQAISQWSEIPVRHVLAIESITGIDRGKLRPDLFR